MLNFVTIVNTKLVYFNVLNRLRLFLPIQSLLWVCKNTSNK